MTTTMNPITFDTYVRRRSYDNGFHNCDVLDTYRYRISSTKHTGVAEVMWDEENGYSIWFSYGNENIIVGELKNLAGAISDIFEKSIAHDKRVS